MLNFYEIVYAIWTYLFGQLRFPILIVGLHLEPMRKVVGRHWLLYERVLLNLLNSDMRRISRRGGIRSGAIHSGFKRSNRPLLYKRQ